jgi:glycosyltransferase involved in cell wall biosynthesis
VRFAQASPRAAVVGPKLVYPDGRLQYSCRKFPTVPGKLLRVFPLALRRAVPWAADEEMVHLDRSHPQPVDYVIGACQLVRRDALESLDGLDERMFYGPEDVDLCLRAWQAGWEVQYLPQAVVIHAEQRRTHRQVDLLTLRHSRALAYYFWKHRYAWRRPRVGRERLHRRSSGESRGTDPSVRPALLHLVTLSEWGGAQACVFALARGFAAEYSVTVGCGPGGPLVSRLRAAGIRVVEVPDLIRAPAPLVDLKALWWLVRWMRRERFTLVHCHSTKAGLLGRFAATIAGVPVRVFTVHGWPFTGWWHPALRWATVAAERMAARISTAVICVSEHDRQRALRLGIGPAAKIRVVHNGVDPGRWLFAAGEVEPGAGSLPGGALWRHGVVPDVRDGGCRVVAVGRLTHQKDPFVLLRAWQLIRGPHRLIIAGDGALRADLEAAIRQHGLAGRVDLLGARDDVPDILHDADVFVMTSRWEGLPLAIIEAMMSGLPVVATAVGGVPEEVVDGETGLLVPPGEPEALARAVQRFLDDPQLRARAGAAGRRRAMERFTEARMLRETAEVYTGVVRGAS